MADGAIVTSPPSARESLDDTAITEQSPLRNNRPWLSCLLCCSCSCRPLLLRAATMLALRSLLAALLVFGALWVWEARPVGKGRGVLGARWCPYNHFDGCSFGRSSKGTASTAAKLDGGGGGRRRGERRLLYGSSSRGGGVE